MIRDVFARKDRRCLAGLLVALLGLWGCLGVPAAPGFRPGKADRGQATPKPGTPDADRTRKAPGVFRLRMPVEGRIVKLPEAPCPRGFCIEARPGVRVRAAAPGTVCLVTASYPGIGPAVMVAHARGYRTLYGPLRILEGLGEKDRVEAGEVLGVLETSMLRFRLLRGDADVADIFRFLDAPPAGVE